MLKGENTNMTKNKDIYIWFINYLKPYKWKITFLITFLLGSTYLISIIPGINAKIISYLFSSNFELGKSYTLILLIVYLFQVFCEKSKLKLMTDLDCGISLNIKRDLVSKLLDYPLILFDKIENGELLSRMNNDVDDVSNVICNYFMTLIDSLLIVIFVGIYMIKLNLVLFIVIAMTFPISLYFFKKTGKKVKEKVKSYKMLTDKCYALESQCLTGIREVMTLGIRNHMKKKMYTLLNDSTKSAFDAQIETIKGNVSTTLINYIDTILFIFISILFIINGLITPEIFVAITSSSLLFMNSISQLTKATAIVQKLSVSLQRLYDFNKGLNYEKVIYGKYKISSKVTEVLIKDLSFSYSNNTNNVLDKLNLNINGYGKYIIIGESGCGKSTIFNLMLRLYEGYTGDIFINNINIRDLSEKELRETMSIVMQEPYMFNLSIKQNLTISNPEVDMNKIIEICKICGIHEFIINLPSQYDTILSEGGYGISVGQKQRIAIARSLIRETPILLLDEVTSALDNETEKNINSLMDFIAQNHIVILITHKNSGFETAKKIYKMEKGKLFN